MAINTKNTKASKTNSKATTKATTKTNRIEDLKDEVKELHPILNKLLCKLPNVMEVEYTHGPDEMGADFVLSKNDPTFGYTDYVGIIAKIGKIVHDYSEIEKQIKDCKVLRFFRGGKEQIRINEIWVIVTGHITPNAQKKIHDEYDSRKIVFIDGSRLEKLINDHMPTFWTDVSLEVGDYLSRLKSKNEATDKSFNLLEIEDQQFYIEQDIYEFHQSDYKHKTRVLKRQEKINIYETLAKKKLILIEGGMGAGKSKLIRQLVEYYTNPEIYTDKKLLPIYLTYKDFIEQFNGNTDQIITKHITENLAREITHTYKYLILVDGFDEKKMSSEEQIDALKTLAEHVDNKTNIKLVITSRYLDGISQTNYIHPSFSRYELRHLSLHKTIEFIKTICQRLNVKSRIIEDLKKSQLFKELPNSPIAAILLAKLINDNSQDLPSNMTELYLKYTELMLGRWDINKGLQSQKEYQALDHILIEMAKYVIDYEQELIPIGDVEQIFDTYLKARNLGLTTNELFEKMVSRCEIVTTEQAKNSLGFKHRTFAEFFYAKGLLRDGHLSVDNRVFELYWTNVFFFSLGLKKDCPEILSSIIELEPNSELQRWVKIVNLANYLLAAYTTPYDIMYIGLKKVMLEAAQFYTEIVSGNNDFVLKKFPQMHLLWFFQMLIRDNYSYDFFKKAIDHTMLSINDSSYEKHIKAYAIFFLSVSNIDINGTCDFNFLAKEYTELPLDLSLALKHEYKRAKLKPVPPIMKKQIKRIESMLQGQLSSSVIKAMYETPILDGKQENTKKLP